MIKLIKPNLKYKNQYLEGVQSLIKSDMYRFLTEEEIFLMSFPVEGDDAKFMFWLIDDEKWLGMITIKKEPSTHKDFPPELASHISYDIKPEEQGKGYGKDILRLGLKEAKKMGFKEIFVACNENNIRSQKVIEFNGGELINDIYVPMIKQSIKRYLFKLI